MKALLIPAVLALFLLPSQSQAGPETSSSSPTTGDPEQALVVLRSGEVLRGTVELVQRRGLTEYVVVNGQSYPYYHVNTFHLDGAVLGFVDVAEPRPLMVVQHTAGRASLYRLAGSDDSSSEFFQIGDGPIKLASHQNLLAAFAEHPGALRYLDHDRRLSYAAIGAVAVGAALIATGAVLEFSDIDGPSGVKVALAGVGFAVAVTGAVAPARGAMRRAAIRAYNQ